MGQRKRKRVALDFSIEGGQWVARGGQVDVTGPTLQATRRRARKAVGEHYGQGVEIDPTLHMPVSLMQRIERHRERRLALKKEREELREETLGILQVLRGLGMSYEDASEQLGIDASRLMRVFHSTQMLQVDDDD